MYLCVSHKETCFYERYVSVCWEFHEKYNSLPFLSYIPMPWLSTKGWGSLYPSPQGGAELSFLVLPWALASVTSFSPRASVSLSVTHGCREKRHETAAAFSLRCSVLAPFSPLSWGKQKRTCLFLKTILQSEAEESAVRRICASGLMDCLMFGCEAQHGCAGAGGCLDAEPLHKERTPSPDSYTSRSLPHHICFLAALSLPWQSGDRSNSDQWPLWLRETGPWINTIANFSPSGCTFQ